MGIFGTIIGGISAGVDVIASNSGDIKGALDAISKVLPFADTAQSAAESPDVVVNLYRKYKAACVVLETKALEIPPPDDSINIAGTTTTSGVVSGLWAEPATLTKDLQASLPMYQDLSTHLTLSGLPPTLTVGGKTMDVAKLMGAALFANAPSPAGMVQDSDPLLTTRFYLPNDEGTCLISAQHVCYDIPLGYNAKNSNWHAAIGAKMEATAGFHKALADRLTRGRVASDRLSKPGPVWLVTVELTWTRTPHAEDIVGEFRKIFEADYPKYKIEMISLVGVVQTLKVAMPLGMAPGSVRPAVFEAAIKTLGAGEEEKASPTVIVKSSAIVSRE